MSYNKFLDLLDNPDNICIIDGDYVTDFKVVEQGVLLKMNFTAEYFISEISFKNAKVCEDRVTIMLEDDTCFGFYAPIQVSE